MIFRHTSTKWLTRESEHQVLLRLIRHQPENRQQTCITSQHKKNKQPHKLSPTNLGLLTWWGLGLGIHFVAFWILRFWSYAKLGIHWALVSGLRDSGKGLPIGMAFLQVVGKNAFQGGGVGFEVEQG